MVFMKLKTAKLFSFRYTVKSGYKAHMVIKCILTIRRIHKLVYNYSLLRAYIVASYMTALSDYYC